MKIKPLILAFTAALAMVIPGCRFEPQQNTPDTKSIYEDCLNTVNDDSKKLCDDAAPMLGNN